MEKFLVSTSTGVMGSVLKKLGAMVSDEYKLLKNVRRDVEFLKDELEVMHAFLLEMADVQEPHPQAKLRANAVRELSYDIEDKIDKFMLLVDDESSSCFDGFRELFSKTMKKIADLKTRHKIAKDVKDIKSQVNEMAARYARYKIDESSRPRNEKVDPRLCAVYKDASELVGIDGPTDKLVMWLSDKDSEAAHHLKVASIVGCGGLGKTTLARQVYNKLGANFEYRAFVSISRSPDMTKILSSMFSQLLNQDDAHAGARDPQLIIDKIRDFLEDKRYFIVIDDLWDEATWRILKCAFAKNSHGSGVMTTTRKNDVAKSCCSSQGNLVYEIKPLSDSDSKKLFFKRIFDSEEKCPPDLKEASEDVLKKCGGLPLAINAISSLLVTRKTKEEWERVRGSIGFAQGRSSDIDAMNYILSLSYFDLPLYLRSCLLYLTMFPEDHEIQRQRLIHRWISEGFIHGEDGEDLVELGDMYFHELINRNLIQPVNIEYDGKASSCRVHDTVLDFLIYKSTEENLCTSLSNHSKPDSRIRRLSLLGNEVQGSVEQLDLSHARSLGSFGKAEQLPSLVKSKALRVLDLENCSGLKNHHVRDIGRLFQLRYLNINSSGISDLPRQIGDLVYLETLDVSQTKLLELPVSVTCLKRMAWLFVPGSTKLPDCIGNMEKLQELGDSIKIFDQSVKFVEELGKLINLRKLNVNLDYDDSDKASYNKKEMLVSSLRKLDRFKLQSLCIKFSLEERDAGTFIEGHPLFLPALKSIREITLNHGQLCWTTKWMLSLANLEKLSVYGAPIGQQEFEMVGRIPSLLEFTVLCCSEPVIINSRNGGVFQQLQMLTLLSLHVRWFIMSEAGAMPNVRKLSFNIWPSLDMWSSDKHLTSLNICPHLNILPSDDRSGFDDIGIQHLSSLAELRVGIYCQGMTAADVEALEVVFRNMAEAHPNRPSLVMGRIFAGFMLKGSDE